MGVFTRRMAQDEHTMQQHTSALRNTVVYGVLALAAGGIVHAVLPLFAGSSGAAAAPAFVTTLTTGFAGVEGWVTVLAIPAVALVAAWHALMRA